MYFKNISNFSFLSINEQNSNLLDIIDFNIESNLYKVEINKLYNSNNYSIHSIDSKYNIKTNSKYPKNALKIYLKKGNYRISYLNGFIINKETGIINDCIWSSKGNINFKQIILNNEDIFNINELNYLDIIKKYNYNYVNNFFDIKITKSSYFYIWLNSNNAFGNINIQINEINTKEYSKNTIFNEIFDKNSIPIINFDKNVMYQIKLYNLLNEKIKEPLPKYPEGTYQIVLNEVIGKSNNNSDLIKIKDIDLTKFNINKRSHKLLSLKNIEISKDVNPLQFYFMLGKIELIGFFNFNNDKFYIYPNSYLECFLSLSLPNNSFIITEENSSYLTFKINEFKHISYNYKNRDEILLNLNKWTGININHINSDLNQLYYYGSQSKLSESFISNIISKHINIESYFIYIKINLLCEIFDNVLNKIKNEDEVLNYNIVECNWEVLNENFQNDYNYINWSNPSNWKNTDIENILYSTISGNGIIKITKQHFKNITNIDIKNVKNGSLSDKQFKELKLNDPLISPYDRFQYWINLKI